MEKEQAGVLQPQGVAYGVVLMNMGGPSSLEEVPEYLRRVLSDPMLVRLPAGFAYQWLFARLVAKRRAVEVRSRYAEIGGSSPLLRETMMQAEGLEKLLKVPVAVAMRYSTPGATQAVATLLSRGALAIAGLPMYPQYSVATSGSSIADLRSRLGGKRPLHIVDRHFDDPGLVATLAEGIRRAAFRLEDRRRAHVLFTAHSVPVSQTRRGDPYIMEVGKTAEAVEAEAGVGLPWSLAYQSAPKFGQWHSPSLDDALNSLARSRLRSLVVVPLSFAAENLETLYDLDIQFASACKARGIADFVRVAAPGAGPAYLESLARRVTSLMEPRRKAA